MAGFKCAECDKQFKTKGALTQHVNREHKDDKAAALRAKFGAAAPRPGGAWKIDQPLLAAPSGVPSIDYAIGIGGVPRGTIIEVFGPPRAGKTLTALTFSAHAQKQGGRVGFVDAERALQPTFLALVPDLDVDEMEYSQPPNGDTAMELTKQFINTQLYDIWTIDSLHACIPQSAIDAEIGSSQARAALARLMSEALPVLEHVVADTNTALILINHVKQKPGVAYGRDWYTPGGSAPEYYSSTRLHVWASGSYVDKDSKRQIGHRVIVKVEKSKVTAPFAKAEYDLFYADGVLKDSGRQVKSGVDVESSWLYVLQTAGRIAKTSAGKYVDLESGEALGGDEEIREQLRDTGSSLFQVANDIVYPEAYRK